MKGITHKQAKRYMLADLDGLLSETQRRDLETHLRDCEACRAESQIFSTLTTRLQSEFHSRWDAKDGPSKNVLKNIQSQTRRITMSNRINLGIKALGGIAVLVALGLIISLAIPQLRESSIASNNTEIPTGFPTESNNLPLIAFVSNKDGNYDIYTMRADGSNMANLTNTPADETSPLWSPDGRKIAFVSGRTGGVDIFVMNSDGSDLIQLTNKAGYDGMFSWSPNGEKIVYVSTLGREPNLEGQLMIMNADGSNKIPLTPHKGLYSFLGWSPDGQSIAFQYWYGEGGESVSGETEVMSASVDGSYIADGPHFVGAMDIGTASQVHWETSDQFVVLSFNDQAEPPTWYLTRYYTHYTSQSYSGFGPSIVTSNSPIVAVFDKTYVVENQDALSWFSYSGSPIPLSPWSFSEICPIPGDPYLQEARYMISPDNKQAFVSFFCRGDNTTSFFLMDDQGSKIHKLGAPSDENKQIMDMNWSPDGNFVIMTIAEQDSISSNLYLFDIKKMLKDPSTNPVQLTSDGVTKYGAVWQPTPHKAIEGKPTPEPYSFTLTVAEAERLAGFDILEPAHLPAGYVFDGAFYEPQSQKVAMKFVSQNGDNGVLYIYQQRGEMHPDPSISAYVTPVAVGDAQGEYVRGAWVYESPGATPTWDSGADFYSLSWEKDGFVISINFLGGETIPPILLDELIAIAESLK